MTPFHILLYNAKILSIFHWNHPGSLAKESLGQVVHHYVRLNVVFIRDTTSSNAVERFCGYTRTIRACCNTLPVFPAVSGLCSRKLLCQSSHWGGAPGKRGRIPRGQYRMTQKTLDHLRLQPRTCLVFSLVWRKKRNLEEKSGRIPSSKTQHSLYRLLCVLVFLPGMWISLALLSVVRPTVKLHPEDVHLQAFQWR